MKNILFSLAILFAITACNPVEKAEKQTVNNDHLLLATVFQQSAPEYDALCIQAYNLASLEAKLLMKNNKSENAPAVVLDLDETVLDNSPFEAKCILENTNYPMYWDEWMNAANARLVPGAKEFLDLANELGMEIYYISNRKTKYLEQTIKNMKMHKLPQADVDHIWLKTDVSSKKARRDKLSTEREIAILIGDNLNDFNEIFEVETNKERKEIVVENKSEFGKRFIILPNPTYGEWVKAALNNSYNHTNSQRDSLFKESLISF
jgi:5'-nucleotidase (lipoprotein e(P4) family)